MKQLQQLFQVMSPILDHIDAGVVVANSADQVIYTNDAASEIMGLPEGQPVRTLADLGAFNFRKRLLRAAIDAGEVDAAGRPSGRFVQFEVNIERGHCIRIIAVSSGLVPLQHSDAQVRLVLLRDETEQRQLQAVLGGQDRELVTSDPHMREILAQISQIAPTDAFVLLQGQSGTGKTGLARMIHQFSQRSRQPFVEVNCAAIPESLIESELFGHIKGAFTGAIQDRQGRFQAADHGTLFLDEISELPLNLQAKLLKVLQDQRFEMVGSDETVQVDVRVISASNQNLRDAVDDGRFRADLYYRLAVIPLTVPPLNDRPGDIPLLVEHFIEQLEARGYPRVRMHEDTMRVLMNHHWPGNVRELANVVEHGVICAREGMMLPESLPDEIRDADNHDDAVGLARREEDLRLREQIQSALLQAAGNRAEAAQILGIDRSTLWRRMKKLGIGTRGGSVS